jgi:hypothetical protein
VVLRIRFHLGPFYDGTFQPVCINSIRRHKTPCLVAKASQSVSLSLDSDIAGLRKGMVLISPLLVPKATMFFQVRISSYLQDGLDSLNYCCSKISSMFIFRRACLYSTTALPFLKDFRRQYTSEMCARQRRLKRFCQFLTSPQMSER